MRLTRTHWVVGAILGLLMNVIPCVADTRSLALDNSDNDPQAYDQWIASTLEKLSGDDEAAQNKAADQLSIAIVYPPVRAKVLAGLEPHVNSTNKDFRLRCVKAYGHWATAAQTKQLLSIVATPPNPPNMSGDEPCWAVSVAALVSLNPDAARSAMQRRMGNFFFRTGLADLLSGLTAEDGPAQPAAYDLLTQLDPNNAAVQVTVADAMALLQSDSASDRTKGASALAHAIVREQDRAKVLGMLRSHLNGRNGHARLPFVQAYARWATPQDVATLEQVIATPPTVSGISGHEDCWASATIGLARLDPKAASEAIASRSGAFLYRVTVQRFLDGLARGKGPTAPTAAWLLRQTGRPGDQPPLPPGFEPGKPINSRPGDVQPRA